MTTYNLEFDKAALKEWKKLNPSIKEHLKKQLAKRLENPHVASAACSGKLKGCYKIKLKSLGYRLIYKVEDDVLVVLVLAIGQRDRLAAYKMAEARL
ncbi:type II toxin-antitoxin system mRNA interferase toxin, RelE/StbE family [Piscirickettsiaceae bacterium NZ-RLO2]|uniref:type II toxin-antitoxin system RelE family toxin n=1 Tax=Piscirickettsia salmonis TaxID=1238 RepID=UPI000F08EA35|nr:type II toxin-antitoxin system mRNA interferase toxin, RelE/StbE family [Piscirickettsiaceae bacterium NZ-RLO2]